MRIIRIGDWEGMYLYAYVQYHMNTTVLLVSGTGSTCCTVPGSSMTINTRGTRMQGTPSTSHCRSTSKLETTPPNTLLLLQSVTRCQLLCFSTL